MWLRYSWYALCKAQPAESSSCKGGLALRFMVIVKATREPEAGVLPSQEIQTAMGKYNEEPANAGVLLAVKDFILAQKGSASTSPEKHAKWSTGRSPKLRN